jgi:hypothetical protein
MLCLFNTCSHTVSSQPHQPSSGTTAMPACFPPSTAVLAVPFISTEFTHCWLGAASGDHCAGEAAGPWQFHRAWPHCPYFNAASTSLSYTETTQTHGTLRRVGACYNTTCMP